MPSDNDDTLAYRIRGEDIQIVEIAIPNEQTIKAEVGAMVYMDDSIYMETTIEGGLIQAIKRRFVGEKAFMPSFTHYGEGKGIVAFAAPHPGKILEIILSDFDNTLLCQKGAFLCGTSDIQIQIAFTRKIGAGLFGKEGFILQKLTGEGLVFIHAGGTLIERELKQDEVIRVDSGCLVAFAPTVDYDVEFIKGIRNAFFGGEGLFLIRLTGPGKVYLQSLPFSSLADRILAASNLLSE